MKLTATLLLILTLSWAGIFVDANPRFKRDNRDDVLKQTEELIKSAQDVLEKLPDSDLKDEIAENWQP
ncbi:zen 1 [Dermatophagoides farinae]|uniref:Zen 1 n=1 Tax=Dermatophagoides farinae TaxID=6954 RepID=A0A9D4NXP0_DERFA|nr:zen 1 [Dermatophagoides farinae]